MRKPDRSQFAIARRFKRGDSVTRIVSTMRRSGKWPDATAAQIENAIRNVMIWLDSEPNPTETTKQGEEND